MPRPARRLIIRSITRSEPDDGLGPGEKRYRELVENSNELIWSADAFGRWTFVNAAARRIYGCAPEEMIGRPMTDWMVPGEAGKDLKTLERILEGERYVQYETRHRRKDGKLVTLSFKTAAVRDAQGNLLGTTGIASDITGQREVEEARRVSEARFRNLFERNLAGVYRTALDGRVIDCNESFARMLGYASRDEVRGRNGRDFYPEPGDREAFLARLREEGSITNSEVRLRRKDGGAVWVLENVHLIEDGSPPEPVIEGTMVDVTDRRRAVDALRESEEYFRSLIDNALDVIMIVDAGGAIRYGSPSLERLLGYKPQEVVEDAVFDYVHPEDGEAVRRMFTAMVHGSGSASAEFRVRHRDGSWRHMEAIGSDLSNHPSVAGLLVQMRDVTERKAADENQARLQFAIQDAAKEWQRTFDAIESPVLVLDGNALIRRLNRAAKVLSGKTYRETIGVRIEALGPGEPWQKSAELAREIRAGGSATSGQARDVATGRTWDVGASLLKAASSESERIILVAREITGVVRLQEKLHHTRTMSAMGSLVAGVAHEVRNPLFGISATLDAFEARFGQRGEYAQYVAVLRGELERLSHLMGDLLEYGKPTSLEFSEGAVAEVVAEAVQGCRALAESRRRRDRDRGGRGPAAHPDGPPAADAGLPEPARQCRPARAAAERGYSRGRADARRRRAMGRLPRPGRGTGLSPGGPVPHLRAVLHAPPRRHGPRPLDRPAHRRGPRRPDRGGQPGRGRRRRDRAAAGGGPGCGRP